MTHAEFIADIQRARSFVDDRNSTMVLSLAAVDHLLAIHAAAVELFDAERAWDRSTNDEAYAAMVRAEAAKSNLAALCGWEWK